MHRKGAGVTERLKMWWMGKEETAFAFLLCIYICFCFHFHFFFLPLNIGKEMVKATCTKNFRLPEWDQVLERDLKDSVVLWELL